MTMQDITDMIDKKINSNRQKVVISFYEVEVKFNLSKEEKVAFLDLIEIRLKNLGYKVYREGQKYFYMNKTFELLPQEKLVAIKE